ncbi:MAG: hypothetical protein AAF502_15665 [Bacteroidota bacterium]
MKSSNPPIFPGPWILLILFIIINLWLYSLSAFILDLHLLTDSSKAEFKAWFPRFYSLLYWVAHNSFWGILSLAIAFIITNAFFVRRVYLFLKNKESLFRPEYILSVTVLVICLTISEIGLRLMGYQSDGIQIGKQIWFKTVENLEIYEGLEGDSLGLFRATPKAIYDVNSTVDYHLGKSIPSSKLEVDPKEYTEIYSLSQVFIDLHLENSDHLLSKKLTALKQKSLTEFSTYESALWTYLHRPLNEYGYRSIPFDSTASVAKRVLLIGDSFTFGQVAEPIINGFADLLLASNYMVYNTGMSGTDPTHYQQIAETFIPIIEPDIVIVNFFLGNDVQYYKKEINPGFPAFYPTNAGNLNSNNYGIYLDNAQEAYEANLGSIYTPMNLGIIGKGLKHTVIGTFFVQSINLSDRLSPLTLTFLKKYQEEIEFLKSDIPNANEKCQKIKEISEKHGARFILSIIPDLAGKQLTKVEDYSNLFVDQNYVLCPSLTYKDYNLMNSHFNNEGHRKYAEFLKGLIESDE